MVDNCMLVKALDKIKEIIGVENFDDSKVLTQMINSQTILF